MQVMTPTKVRINRLVLLMIRLINNHRPKIRSSNQGTERKVPLVISQRNHKNSETTAPSNNKAKRIPSRKRQHNNYSRKMRVRFFRLWANVKWRATTTQIPSEALPVQGM